MSSDNKVNQRIIGKFGEMSFIMQAHQKGWQIHRHVLGEIAEFALTRLWCKKCGKLSELEMRPILNKLGEAAGGRFHSDCCKYCKEPELIKIVRFIQVETSEGKGADEIREYSFYAKLRSNVDPRSFYAWVALLPEDKAHIYIFHHTAIRKFDDLSIDSYQKTDNQKTTLRINNAGEVVKHGRKYNFECFNDEFKNNFEALNEIIGEDTILS